MQVDFSYNFSTYKNPSLPYNIITLWIKVALYRCIMWKAEVYAHNGRDVNVKVSIYSIWG